MKYLKTARFWITNFGAPDVSFGVHFCAAGRIDIHFLFWMLSFGKVPIYQNKSGKQFAVSNSFHKTQKGPLRDRSLP